MKILSCKLSNMDYILNQMDRISNKIQAKNLTCVAICLMSLFVLQKNLAYGASVCLFVLFVKLLHR